MSIEVEADVTILDEKEGRHAAERFGLHVVGVLGILLLAKSRGIIAEVGSHLDSLRTQAGFYISESVARTVLQMADE